MSESKFKRTLAPFYVHQWLDILDTDNKWLEAQVTGVSDDQSVIRIHYKGWNYKYDECLVIEKDLDRIALLNQHTKPSQNEHFSVPAAFYQGMQLFALDPRDIWYEASISDVWMGKRMVFVRYLGWAPMHDEWINMESHRLGVEPKKEVQEDDNFYDTDLFVNISELEKLNLVCSICLRVCKKVVETDKCGHFFCKECIGSAFVKAPTCPNCRTKGVSVRPSVSAARHINAAFVRCPIGNDCLFTCERGQVAKHKH